jgi:uncharacterized membrane protein
VIRIELSVQVSRPVDEVFAYVTDPTKLAEWQPNVISVTKLNEGPVRSGTRFKEVRRALFGRSVEAIVEVSAYEENHRIDLRIVSGPVPVHGENEFTSIHGGTRIDFVAHGELRGALRMAQPVLARVLRRQFESDYARLKRALESRE